MSSFSFNLGDGFLGEFIDSILEPQRLTLGLPDGSKVELVNESQLREQIAREIENLTRWSPIIPGSFFTADLMREEEYGDFLNREDVLAAIARGEK